MRIADVVANKGRAVVTLGAGNSVSRLLEVLAEHNIGAAVVVGSDGAVNGIVSERDVVRGLADRGERILAEPVAAIMTTDVVTCAPGDQVESLTVVMTDRRIRHVPVVDGEQLIGIVSIGDVVKARISALEHGVEQMESYITRG